MIKVYDLQKNGTEFKAEFNWNFDLIKHLLEIRTQIGYLKIDLIRNKSSSKTFIGRRITNFKINKAVFETKEFSCPYPKQSVLH